MSPRTASPLGSEIVSALAWGQFGMSVRTLLSFLVSIIVARTLGARDFGVYAALATLMEMATRTTEMGLHAVMSRYLPQLREQNPARCSYLVRRVLAYRFLLLLLAVALLHAFSEPLVRLIGASGPPPPLALLSVWIIVRGSMDSVLFVVIASLEMRLYSAVEIGVSIFQISGALLLTAMGMGVSDVIVLMIAVNAIQLVCYAASAFKIVRPRPQATDLAPIARFGATLWLSNFLQYFRFKSIDVFLILYVLKDPARVGFYEVAYVVTMRGGYVLLSSLRQLALTIYSESYERFGIEGIRRVWGFLTKVSIYLAAPALIFLSAHATDIIQILYSDAYAESAGLIRLFCILVAAGVFLSSETSDIVVLPLDRERVYLYVRMAGGVANICLNLLLIPPLGAMGAVLSTGSTIVFSSLFELEYARRLVQVRLPLRFIMQIILCITVALSWTLLFRNIQMMPMIFMALAYGTIVTVLLLKIHHLSTEEKSLFQHYSPRAYATLSRLALLN